MNGLTTAKKLEMNMKSQGRTKSWLAEYLGITRGALYNKLRDNFFTVKEIIMLKNEGLI